MFKKNDKKQRGILALFPAIIISGILLILCVSVSQSFLAFLYRNTLFEKKTQTNILARACALRVLAKHAQDEHYAGGETIYIEGYPCVVDPIATSTGQVSVRIDEAISIETVSFI